ncbi:MAG: orotidine-5'-phosphate decarboxylase [Actinomycetota bacterium]|jgi:orotidine-5'-phosphate decarboxylase|nr:orotidine-5'-phosphate decarboxylase [Actinomycetota bacterium]
MVDPVRRVHAGAPTDDGAGFAARVAAALSATGPLCVGIDPSPSLVAQWGLADDGPGLEAFGLRVVEALAGEIAVVKPQVAFFERHGSAGYRALESVVAAARQAGLLVVADAKRGDIGSTAEAYAAAWLDPASPLAADAVTAVAYLGMGALEPLVTLASATGRGVIVVARSSNPEGAAVQAARTADGTTVGDAVLAAVAEANASGRYRPGTIGAVVGATLEPSAFDLSTVGGVLLLPGVGAQGATPASVARLAAGCSPGTVLPSSSRSILVAGPEPGRLRAAAVAERDALANALGS